MNTWTPLWSSIVGSSLWDEPDHVCKVFITLMALKDRDHIVRRTAYQIARDARKTEKEVLDALEILSSPDKRREEYQPFEGRRVRKVEEGWLVINGEKYRQMIQSIYRKESKRESQRKARARKKKAYVGSPATANEKLVKQLRAQGNHELADRMEEMAVSGAVPPESEKDSGPDQL